MTANPRTGRGVATFFRNAQMANAIVVLDGVDIILSTVQSEQWTPPVTLGLWAWLPHPLIL